MALRANGSIRTIRTARTHILVRPTSTSGRTGELNSCYPYPRLGVGVLGPAKRSNGKTNVG